MLQMACGSAGQTSPSMNSREKKSGGFSLCGVRFQKNCWEIRKMSLSIEAKHAAYEDLCICVGAASRGL
ncbi:hypothetical protein NECAME_11286 [Necator americanus]|uniref:Uncharacterized protein n=1 Tax=Necator americanus TaxID=51031 RepID=W2T634_NECAM|nr:hypothetical protein NECAME_11286 [Necator americanus]ETN77084.1 hypothetical protein NECAME_11286 [Necator americanus]